MKTAEQSKEINKNTKWSSTHHSKITERNPILSKSLDIIKFNYFYKCFYIFVCTTFLLKTTTHNCCKLQYIYFDLIDLDGGIYLSNEEHRAHETNGTSDNAE